MTVSGAAALPGARSLARRPDHHAAHAPFPPRLSRAGSIGCATTAAARSRAASLSGSTPSSTAACTRKRERAHRHGERGPAGGDRRQLRTQRVAGDALGRRLRQRVEAERCGEHRHRRWWLRRKRVDQHIGPRQVDKRRVRHRPPGRRRQGGERIAGLGGSSTAWNHCG